VRNTGNFSTKIIEDAVSKGIISVHEASELVKNITQRANTILKVVGEAESLHETLIKQRNQLSEQNQINEFNTLNNELKDVQKKAEAKAYASMENTKKITTATQLIMSGYAKHIQAQQPYDMNVASRKRPEAPNGGRRTHRKRKHKRTHRKRR
jgi:polyhydroxyalkanoate synthesis regulator phasin